MNFFKKYPQFLIVAIICLLATLFVKYVYFDSPRIKPSTSVITDKVDKLESEKKQLKKRIDSINTQVSALEKRIDSITKITPKIKIKYVKTYREIDSSNTSYLSKKFDSIFSVNHIK